MKLLKWNFISFSSWWKYFLAVFGGIKKGAPRQYPDISEPGQGRVKRDLFQQLSEDGQLSSEQDHCHFLNN